MLSVLGYEQSGDVSRDVHLWTYEMQGLLHLHSVKIKTGGGWMRWSGQRGAKSLSVAVGGDYGTLIWV